MLHEPITLAIPKLHPWCSGLQVVGFSDQSIKQFWNVGSNSHRPQTWMLSSIPTTNEPTWQSNLALWIAGCDTNCCKRSKCWSDRTKQWCPKRFWCLSFLEIASMSKSCAQISFRCSTKFVDSGSAKRSERQTRDWLWKSKIQPSIGTCWCRPYADVGVFQSLQGFLRGWWSPVQKRLVRWRGQWS